ncbi:MAG: chemotaxis protein CheB [bacterium]
MAVKKKNDMEEEAKKGEKVTGVELAAEAEESKEGAGFPVVGIGASAGGLAAFEAFFSGMPADADPGMAFVLVQHLAPDHKSILTDLVKRYTRMQVFEVEDGVRVKPNCAYIIPPNRDMAFMDGTLQLLEPVESRGQRMPIDFFFRTLAHDQRERAICIVLSGTGSDGALGVRAVKGEGGMAMAQNPESTEFDGMPRSAIATGMVDYVLPPAEMPARLIAYSTRAFGAKQSSASQKPPAAENAFKKIFVLLRSQTGHDFSQYKQSTILRRVERRMAVHQIEGLEEYIRYLRQTPTEVEALFRDLLIGVTNFFRDTEAFKALNERVIPELFAGRPSGSSVRVWVPGCSTGEEAYSIAILLYEHLESLKQNFILQVFATDIDRSSIEHARAGVYHPGITADVSPERLEKFFTREADGGVFRVSKKIRDILIFSEQNVIKDPPFSKLDLISCRNLLIYMDGDLQKKLIPLFHYALKPGGFLFLGTSETVGGFGDIFNTLDRNSKLYQRKEDISGIHRLVMGNIIPPISEQGTAARLSKNERGEKKMSLRDLAERTLLEQFVPAGALINRRGDILFLHGRTGRYLEPAPGEAGMNILNMAREGLKRDLTAAMQSAAAQRVAVRRTGLRVKTNGDFTTINLTISPVAEIGGAEEARDLLLVVFEEAPETDRKQNTKAEGSTDGAALTASDSEELIAALRKELLVKEEYLQATIEQVETSNEELKSSNEEMQSVNEELQSTNEELETSKEELQSVNEELATVNAELMQKVSDLSRANNDMSNILAGTGIGIIFVDSKLHIQRFTPTVREIINLIPTDVGRPVGHIASNLAGYDRLEEDVQGVLDNLVMKEVETQTKAGLWYQLRIRPYRTIENVIEGAVITFVDITEIKRARESLKKSEALSRLAIVVRDSRDCITVQDLNGRIMEWNPGAVRMYGWSEAEAIKMNVRDLIPESRRKEELATVKRLSQSGVVEPYFTQRIAKDGRIVDVWLTATALVNEVGHVYAIATTERNRDKEA